MIASHSYNVTLIQPCRECDIFWQVLEHQEDGTLTGRSSLGTSILLASTSKDKQANPGRFLQGYHEIGVREIEHAGRHLLHLGVLHQLWILHHLQLHHCTQLGRDRHSA